MEIIVPITVDLTAPQPPRRYITARQCDGGIVTLRVALTNGGKVIAIPDGITAVLNIGKADDHNVMITGKPSLTYIDFVLTAQSLAAVGETECDVQLLEGLRVVTSARFLIMVAPRVISDEDIESSDEYNTLAEALVETQAATQGAASAAETALASGKAADTAAEAANAAAHAANAAKAEADAAKDAANTAAQKADTAAAGANDATAAANTAAQSVTNAKSAAEAAAESANTAAQNANTSTQNANTAAQAANAAKSAADTAASSANAAAAEARAAKTEADAAKDAATEAAGTATTAAEAATTAAGEATQAAEAATTAADAANAAAEAANAAVAGLNVAELLERINKLEEDVARLDKEVGILKGNTSLDKEEANFYADQFKVIQIAETPVDITEELLKDNPKWGDADVGKWWRNAIADAKAFPDGAQTLKKQLMEWDQLSDEDADAWLRKYGIIE